MDRRRGGELRGPVPRHRHHRPRREPYRRRRRTPLRTYVLLEQTAVGATVFQRQAGGPWIACAMTEGTIDLPGPNVAVPLADLYRGLTFPTR